MSDMANLVPRNDQSIYVQEHLAPYMYVPTPAVCLMFIALFGVALAGHFIRACMHRAWFLFPTMLLGVAVEVLGWAGRYWSSQNIMNGNAFMIQITSTILAPTPILAANFVVMGRLVRSLGSNYSVLSPRLYTIVFLSCDIIALAVQGLGGGLVSGTNVPQDRLNLGSNLMLGGIVFQLVAIVVYMALGTHFYYRYRNDKPMRRDENASPRGELTCRFHALVIGLALSTLFLFVRAIYRTVELSDGWTGKVMATQWLFNLFDATMVLLAVYTILIAHPGWLLQPKRNDVFGTSGSKAPPMGRAWAEGKPSRVSSYETTV